MQIHQRLGFFLGPLFFLFLLFVPLGLDPLTSRVLAVGAWMMVWWITETFPIYITAMLPMVFFPALDILSVTETFMPYGSPIIFLFLGGFIIALAMEERQLHRRIAFGLVRFTGTKPSGIVLGFMLATAVVAMWISNTATAVMMLPIALSVIRLLEREPGIEQRVFKRFALLMMLAIAYGASIGGTMTLIGTPPNLVFAGYYLDHYGTEVTFLQWMLIGMPVGMCMLLGGFLLLSRVIFPLPTQGVPGARELFEREWKALGRMNRAERAVLLVFGFTVFVWVFSAQINALIGRPVLNNTNIAMTGGILMFVVPVNWKKGEFILDWKCTQRLPWGILILFGGGLCLAQGLEEAGIIDNVGKWVASNMNTNAFLLCTGLTVLALLMTEVMSNVALVTVLLPVVMGVSDNLGINGMYLSVPVTLAASCAFMMPISTPPNAIVYSSGHISVGQMVRAGLWMNMLAITVIVVLCQLLLG